MKKIIAGYCNLCRESKYLEWDFEQDGYKVYCPKCQNRLMLCGECSLSEQGVYSGNCDYNDRTDCCSYYIPDYVSIDLTFEETLKILNVTKGKLHISCDENAEHGELSMTIYLSKEECKEWLKNLK